MNLPVNALEYNTHVKRFSELDSQKSDILRGIAIIAVYLFHAVPLCITANNPRYNRFGVLQLNSFNDAFLTFSPPTFGGSGVTLFLIISGFLIHYGFLNNMNDFKLRMFYSKRFCRIYPPYILILFFICFATNEAYYYSERK